MKEHAKNWIDTTYKVIEIDRSGINGQTRYKLDGLSKGYFRNELLLVEWINYLISQYSNWVIVILIKVNNNDIIFL